jgi:hypothetical protein
MRVSPKTNTAGDFSATNSFPKSLGKYHEPSDYQRRNGLTVKPDVTIDRRSPDARRDAFYDSLLKGLGE